MPPGVTQTLPQDPPQPQPQPQPHASAQDQTQAPARHQSQAHAPSQDQVQAPAPVQQKAQAQPQTANDWNDLRNAIVERMLAGGGRPGVVDPTEAAGSTGLEVLEAMLRGEVAYPPIADTLDFALIEVEAGRAVFQGTPQLKHYNPMGTVHGGWYATLLDSALGCAVQSTLPAGRAYTTVELGMNIVRAASHRSGPLRAIGSVIHSGRQLATAEARIVDPDGRIYAHATTTCLVFEVAQRERR